MIFYLLGRFIAQLWIPVALASFLAGAAILTITPPLLQSIGIVLVSLWAHVVFTILLQRKGN